MLVLTQRWTRDGCSKGLELAWDKAIGLWTCYVPTPPPGLSLQTQLLLRCFPSMSCEPAFISTWFLTMAIMRPQWDELLHVSATMVPQHKGLQRGETLSEKDHQAFASVRERTQLAVAEAWSSWLLNYMAVSNSSAKSTPVILGLQRLRQQDGEHKTVHSKAYSQI